MRVLVVLLTLFLAGGAAAQDCATSADWPDEAVRIRRHETLVTRAEKVLRTLSTAGLVRGGRGATGGYRFTGNRKRTTLMDIVALFEPAPGRRAPEPGEATEIGQGLQRVLSEIDEIAEATLRSISLETMLNPRQ